METHVGKWGASCAIRLPKMAVEMLGLHPGELVTLTVQDKSLILSKAAPKYSLEDLVRQMDNHYVPESFDDGAVGKEIL